MNNLTNEELLELISKAVSGDKKSLEMIILGVQDLVFNLSLRMLGTFQDAEDASQDILLKIITHLSSFKCDSSFSTWVFSIAVNHLKNYKKHMFAKFPLSFEYYGDDILNGKIDDVPDLTHGRLISLAERKFLRDTVDVLHSLFHFNSCFWWYLFSSGKIQTVRRDSVILNSIIHSLGTAASSVSVFAAIFA